MRNRKKHYLPGQVFLMFLLLFMAAYLNAGICLNNIDDVFPPPPVTEGGSSSSIKELMIEGASYFMQSYASATLLMYEYEIGEKGYFNFTSSLNHVSEAIEKLEAARKKYSEALDLAVYREYISEKVTQLKTFDYSNHANDEGLNSEMATKVAGYLSKGDVRGIYTKNLNYIDSIMTTLNSIKNNLTEGVKPQIELYWTLTRSFSDTMMFGNYATAAAKKAFAN